MSIEKKCENCCVCDKAGDETHDIYKDGSYVECDVCSDKNNFMPEKRCRDCDNEFTSFCTSCENYIYHNKEKNYKKINCNLSNRQVKILTRALEDIIRVNYIEDYSSEYALKIIISILNNEKLPEDYINMFKVMEDELRERN